MKKETFCEILGEISDEHIKEAQDDKNLKKRPRWRRWTAAVACVAIVGVLSGVVFHAFLPAQSDSDDIVLNQMDMASSSIADADVIIYSLSDGELDDAKRDFQTATGISYEDFITKFPDTWQVANISSIWSRDYSGEKPSDEYFLHDYVFYLEETDGDGSATVSLCAFEEPLRDCVLVSESPELSRINDVELVINGVENQMYMTQFSYENLYYDLEIRDISIEELHELLAGILS